MYDSYIICTAPRSGSTLLCKLLEATGIAGRPGSHFHDPSIEDWLGYYDLKPDATRSERETLDKVFRAAITYGRGNTGLFGLRLQRHSAGFFLQKLAILHPGHSSDVERLGAAFGRTLFIYLTRTDKVDQAVSYVRASQGGLWHKAPDGTELERLSPHRDPVYDSAEIRAQFEEFVAYDQAWQQWFAAEGIEPLQLTYDSLSSDPLGTLREVLERLGLDPSAAEGVEPGTAKLADAVSRDWVERFRRD